MNMAKTPKGNDNPAVKAMQAQREDRAKANEEAMKRMESSQPTPTQEENDLAKLGVVVEEKEDDKSGETVITKTIVANQPLGPYGYETRSTKAKE
jgi:hypothetical protein